MMLLCSSLDPLTQSSRSEEDQGRKMENYQKMEKIGEGKASHSIQFM